jgi:hypothetical protein
MIRALLLGFRQLFDPAVQRLLLRCVLLTLATFVALIGAVSGLLFGLTPSSRPLARSPCWCWRGCCSRSRSG